MIFVPAREEAPTIRVELLLLSSSWAAGRGLGANSGLSCPIQRRVHSALAAGLAFHRPLSSI